MFEFNLKNYNFALLIVCIILNILGLVFINSSLVGEMGSFMSQLRISIGAIILCLMISMLNLRIVLDRVIVYYILCVVLLLAVLITGTAFGRNAVRWIYIPVINMQLQPSEFAKLFVIVYLAKYIEKLGVQINEFINIVKVVLIFAIPCALIFIQPNLSSTLILFFIFFGILFASKLKTKWFVISGGIMGLLFLIIFLSVKFGFIYDLPLLKDYQKNRIVSFFEPTEKSEAQYQQENSVIAIGSGKMLGKGINNDSPESVKNGNWLAEAQNDFIFAVVGEEVGFVGSTIIILLYIYLVISCLVTASKQRVEHRKLICVGVACWIGIQSFINIGVATSIIPNTGVPLPFFSQGGSSLLSIYMAMGLILNIGRGV